MEELKTYCKNKNIEIIINYEMNEVFFNKFYYVNDTKRFRTFTTRLTRINNMIDNDRIDFLIRELEQCFID